MGPIIFVLIMAEVIVRVFSSFLSQTPMFEWDFIPTWEKWLIISSAVLFCIWFWEKFISTKCPKCKSRQYTLQEAQEIDRWLGTKQVTERSSGGQSYSRTVNATFVKIERFYKCNNCKNEWSEVSTEEKT
jgi:ribosomal protein S27E